MRVQAPAGVCAGALGWLCIGSVEACAGQKDGIERRHSKTAQKDPARRIHSQDVPGGVDLSRALEAPSVRV